MKKAPKRPLKLKLTCLLGALLLLGQVILDVKLIKEAKASREALESVIVPAIVYLIQQSQMSDKGM